jgi:KaiC/GvpD/RAD55 family RecA-like ATPase
MPSSQESEYPGQRPESSSPVPQGKLAVALHAALTNKWTKAQHEHEEKQHPYRNAWCDAIELAEHIATGCAWLAGHFKGTRDRDGYQYSNTIVLDFDGDLGDLSLERFWALPFATSYCLFTSTTCSHTEAQHSFRAVFAIDGRIETVEQHQAVYAELVEELEHTPKDPCGASPDRLWYGNDATQIRYGSGRAVPGSIIAAASERAARRAAAAAEARANYQGDERDEARCVYLLEHLLPRTVQHDYLYWAQVLNLAAATGSDRIRAAFFSWHSGGFHRNQRQVEKRFDKAGSRTAPDAAMCSLFALCRERLGQHWQRQLPRELQWGGAPTPMLSIFRARPRDETIVPASPPSPVVGDGDSIFVSQQESTDELKPSDAAAELKSRQPSYHFGSPPPTPPPGESQPTGAEPEQDDHRIKKLLDMLYAISTGNVIEEIEGSRALTREEIREHEIQIRNELLNEPYFRRSADAIEEELLHRFAADHSIDLDDSISLTPRFLRDFNDVDTGDLLQGLLKEASTYMLYGKAGSGKTTLALSMARSIIGAPGHTNFLGYEAPAGSWGNRRVLMIASDGGQEAAMNLRDYSRWHGMLDSEWINRYFKVIATSRSLNAPPWRMSVAHFHQLNEELMHAAARGEPYAAVIFDSLKAIAPKGVRVGDQGFIDYFRVLSKICIRHNATQIFIHHQAKDTESPQGISGLEEETSGNFQIKKDDAGRHLFIVRKTRASFDGNREIPFHVANGQLLSDATPAQQQDHRDGRDELLAYMQYDKEEWMQQARLTPGATAAYPGIGIEKLAARFFTSDLCPENFTSARSVERLIQRLMEENILHRSNKPGQRTGLHITNQDDIKATQTKIKATDHYPEEEEF